MHGNAPVHLPAMSISKFRKLRFNSHLVAGFILFAAGNAWGKSDLSQAEFEKRAHKVLNSVDWAAEGGGAPTPDVDLRALYDMILHSRAKRVLEVGTAAGKSAIWMAMAVRQTGGKIITIEINKGRHEKALANFKKAGVSEYIDARLADAHALVKELPGPFDMVFVDADKEWSKNYFEALAPKVVEVGCIITHDTGAYFLARAPGAAGMTKEFLQYLKTRSDFETVNYDLPGGKGMTVSYKKYTAPGQIRP